MMELANKFETIFSEMPILCVLRGVRPEEVLDVASSLFNAGLKVIEVPLNSPEPFRSIDLLVREFGCEAIIGAGTVLDKASVDRLADVGGEVMVSPNVNREVISQSILKGIIPIPGFATATEAFEAYDLGARYLKSFPASVYGVQNVKALSAVLPSDVKIVATGGINQSNLMEWLDAGIGGAGFGASLYSAGDSPEKVGRSAKMVVDIIRQYQSSPAQKV